MASRRALSHVLPPILPRQDFGADAAKQDIVKNAMAKGQLVPDDLVIEVVVPHLQRVAGSHTAFLLQNFPLTPAQASALHRAALVPTKYLLYDVDPTVGRRWMTERQRPAALGEAQWRTYLGYLNDVVAYHRGLMHYFDAAASPAYNAARMRNHLDAPVHNVRGITPARLVVIGPVGSGKTTHARRLARAMDVIHVSSAALLRNFATGPGADAEVARTALEEGELVPDAIVIAVMRKRLEQVDVRSQGFVLDGFPRTASQAQWLLDFKLVPSRVLLLSCDDATVLGRLSGMRLDPETNELYATRSSDSAMGPPPGVHHRLVPVDVKPSSWKDAQRNFRDHISTVQAKLAGPTLQVFDVTADNHAVAAAHEKMLHFCEYPLASWQF